MQQRSYVPAASTANRTTGQSLREGMDWAGEISVPRSYDAWEDGMGSMQGDSGMQADAPLQNGLRGGSAQRPEQTGLALQSGLSDETITAPVTTGEVYAGSIKAMLRRNLGNYVVATFLVGTQNTVSWEGVLYDVGNDYVTIYQQGRDRYIVNDIYSLKYLEFYDVQRRRLCQRLIREQGLTPEEDWSPSR